MSYNSSLPADTTAPEEIRENFRALKEDKIVAANTAATLETARTINGVSFDGSADIVITQVDGKDLATVDQITAASVTVPIGGIIMWSGSVDAIPENWALCNGESDTPDLLDKFVLGAGNSYVVGATGGEETHTLTTEEIPAHNHMLYQGWAQNNSKGLELYQGNMSYAGIQYSLATDDTGGGVSHNNMPPYYALAYIMRIA